MARAFIRGAYRKRRRLARASYVAELRSGGSI